MDASGRHDTSQLISQLKHQFSFEKETTLLSATFHFSVCYRFTDENFCCRYFFVDDRLKCYRKVIHNNLPRLWRYSKSNYKLLIVLWLHKRVKRMYLLKKSQYGCLFIKVWCRIRRSSPEILMLQDSPSQMFLDTISAKPVSTCRKNRFL